ncbi:MAG: 23S rRNA (adenine(2503)-C(2))-methyltransferase RlmN [Phycisphaerales bacterium]|nr:23S rRNA (adenine(2503)-C(2))-methyltransferase RlmN [Phycisphaerales bacterium]
MLPAFFDQDMTSLGEWCLSQGLPRRVSVQLASWVYGKGVIDPAAMTDLAIRTRELIGENMQFAQGFIDREQHASDETRKLLINWPESVSETSSESSSDTTDSSSLTLLNNTPRARQTECVMIPADNRRTACVSSQVGCPVGCRFCASGIGGLEGNLTTGRIVEQVWHLSRLSGVQRISHVVFMGMGEPLANFNAVTRAIRTLHADWGFAISARRITISTVGLPAAIRRLCTFELPVTLALSLHAPNDDLRRQIIPWAEYATIAELLDACDEWFAKTGREITLEYILLGGFNDQREHAEELATLSRRLRANINLIRFNEVKGMPFSRPSSEHVHEFQEVLRARGANVHIRASRGRDIAAACGQLRHETAAARTDISR